MNGKPRDMDYSFAIKVLSTAKVDTPSMHGNPKGYGYQNQAFYDIARKMAISALKKQIPQKPSWVDSVPHSRCPVCHNAVAVYIDSPKLPYCYWCGQALDWSDTE